jgi:hypothetical protein
MFSFLYNDNSNDLASKKIAVVHPAWTELPKSHFGYAANNVYPGFPPIMEDGRSLVASWQPESVVNDQLLKEQGITSNWEYRKYMTHNAPQIVKRNFIEAANDVGYYERLGMDTKSQFEPIPAPLHTKEFGQPISYQTIFDKQASYGFTPSDLKTEYLTREQLQARMVVPAVTQEELLKMQSKK